MDLKDFETCVNKADDEKEIVACKEDYDIGDKPLKTKRKADKIVQEHAIENIDQEKLSDIIEESYFKNKEIRLSLCADGSLKSKNIGEEKTVKRGAGEECRYVGGFIHTHPARDLEYTVEPSAKDIYGSYQHNAPECIARKIDLGEPDNPDIRNTVQCIGPNKDSSLGESLWDKRFDIDEFIDRYRRADIIERGKAYKPLKSEYWD